MTYHLDDNSKNFARCLFIDFTSAFNTISPTILTHLLTDTELHGNIINLVYSFMTNRSQCVVTDVGMSSSRSTSVGSPQGCVLSPVLFSLYIQHMPTPNHGSYHLIKYADDTILLELMNNNVPSTLPSAAIELVDWFQRNELVLNVGKTKELIFSNARDNPICDNLMINGTSVEQVESFTYLGTVVDSKLNFKSNTEAVVKKARKRLFIAIFFPRVILYNFFLFLLIYGGLGFWGWGLILGFWGWGFQLMGFGACGVGPSGFFGFGLSI